MSTAFLKQVGSGQQVAPLPLSASEVTIGRDPSCQLVLDSVSYTMVSRRHASIRPVAGLNSFEICDLGSANGTFVNGQRLQGCQRLYSGDRISLGQNGPELIFEYQNAVSAVGNQAPNQPFALRAHLPQIDSNLAMTALRAIVPGVVTYVLAKILGLVLPLALTIGFWRGYLFFSNPKSKETALQVCGGMVTVELVLLFFSGWNWFELWWISLIGLIALVAALPNENGRILLGTSLSPSSNVRK